MTDTDKKYCDDIAVRVLEIMLREQGTCGANYEMYAQRSYNIARAMLHARENLSYV